MRVNAAEVLPLLTLVVPAEGIEHSPGRFRKWLAANEFWSKSLIRCRLQLKAVPLGSPGFPWVQRRSTGLVETDWRRPDHVGCINRESALASWLWSG